MHTTFNLMKLVFISLEFTAGTFSGNGVYAANQVQQRSRLIPAGTISVPGPLTGVCLVACAGPRSGTLGARGACDRRDPGSSQQSQKY